MLVSVWTNKQGLVYDSKNNPPLGNPGAPSGYAEWLVHPATPTTFKGWLKFKLFYVALRIVKWASK